MAAWRAGRRIRSLDRKPRATRDGAGAGRVDNKLRDDLAPRFRPLTSVRGSYIDVLYKDYLNTERLLPTEGEGCR